MWNGRYSRFLAVVLVSFLLLLVRLALAVTQPQDGKEKAFEVAHDACGIFRRMGIEQVNNSEAVLETGGESTISKIWVVRLTGVWQPSRTPIPTSPGEPFPSSDWLVVCEVSIFPDNWTVISTHITRTKASP